MKKCLILLSFLANLFSFAQSIEGKIINDQKTELNDTEITATNDKDKQFTITDGTGKFNLNLKANGTYLIEIFKDGEKLYSESVLIEGTLKKTFIVKSPPQPETKLEGVVVTARKKLIERKVDRLVFNVENSISAQGLDAMEALSKTPMLRTTDNAISIAGKSNVAVMVNDKMINLSGDELINYLKTLRSDDIAKIEVITTPPSKYEAEGKSGLINIVLKKNTSLGWNAAIQMSGNYYYGHPITSSRTGGSFNYQGKKLSVTTSLSAGENFWAQKSYTHNLGNGNSNYWNTDSEWFNNFKNKNGNVKVEYKINDKNTIGVSYNISDNKNKEKAENKTSISDEEGQRSFLSNGDNLNHRKIQNTSAFYDIKLDSTGGKLSFSGNLMLNKSNANNYYNTIQNTTSSTFVNPINDYKIYAGQIDFEKDILKVKMEAGVKYTKIQNDSQFNFYDIINYNLIKNKIRSNNFLYNEENYAAYASASFKISEKWDAKAGLRYEKTNLEGYSETENSTSKNNYGKLFPTAYIAYKPTEDHSISFNYSRRISRPNFGNLNPFKYYTSEFEYNTGNPYLSPIFTNNFELSYVLKNNFNVTAFYNHNVDNYDRIQMMNNGIKYSTVLNFYNEDQIGVNIGYNYTQLKWLESNVFLNGFYSKSKAYIPEAINEMAGYGASMSINNYVFLNKEKTVTFILGMYGNVPNRSGNTYFNASASLYSGIRLNLMEKKLMINFNVDDLLNTERSKGTEYYQAFNSEYYYKGKTRRANFSVTYKFGNNNVKGATKQLKFDDTSRAGGQ